MKLFKKSAAMLLSIILVISSLSIVAFAYDNDDFDVSDYTWEDIMSMSNSEYRALLSDFERVYDPFDTYETDPIIEPQNNDGIQLYWTSGETDMSETGSHELITARACGILLSDVGFWGENKNGSIIIGLTLSLASILPDKNTIDFSGHFYDPDTEKNFIGNKINTALTNVEFHYVMATNSYDEQEINESFIINVGKMLHYIQDASEPHHAANIIANPFNNAHGQFESFADENLNSYIDSFTTINASEYIKAYSSTPGSLLKETAKKAKNLSSKVNKVSDKSQWSFVANITTRNAVQYSAMLLYKLSIDLSIPLAK